MATLRCRQGRYSKFGAVGVGHIYYPLPSSPLIKGRFSSGFAGLLLERQGTATATFAVAIFITAINYRINPCVYYIDCFVVFYAAGDWRHLH